ncbi:MAG: hypothetical protein Q8Q23_03555 [bacterium]|nr:hypothetical protein [bacterium]
MSVDLSIDMSVPFQLVVDQNLPAEDEEDAHSLALEEIAINGTRRELLAYLSLIRGREND